MSSSAGTLEGDFQEYEISLGDNTNMELTSQSFEKIFTMLDDEAFRECNIYIGSNSLLRCNLLLSKKIVLFSLTLFNPL